MEKVFISLGGNLGDRIALQEQAKKQIILDIGPIVNASSYYETPAWGYEDNQNYCNSVIEIETELNPFQVLKLLMNIEANLGRDRDASIVGYTSRTIDLDILFYGNQIINEKELEIPHPRLHLRMFNLLPLKEIAPNFIHPVLKSSIKNLFLDCSDDFKSIFKIKDA